MRSIATARSGMSPRLSVIGEKMSRSWLTATGFISWLNKNGPIGGVAKSRNWQPVQEVWLNCPKDAETQLTALSKVA